MKRTLLCTLCSLMLSMMGVTAWGQQINGDFDGEWVECTPWDSENGYYSDLKAKDGYVQPTGWVISHVSGMKGMGATVVGSKVSGYTGNEKDYAVELKNTPNPYRSSEIVPAYLTLGVSWATAKATIISVSNADGGTYGGISFSNRPDAVSFYYKRSLKDKSQEKATVVAYLWKGKFTQENVPACTKMGSDPKKITMIDRDRQVLGMSMEGYQGGATSQTDDALCIASINESITEAQSSWTKKVLEFKYSNLNAIPEKANLIFAADDYFGDRSKIESGNTLSVDGVEFIYYHALSSCEFDGQKLSFSKASIQGVDSIASVDAVYHKGAITYVKKGVGATVDESYDALTSRMTITVKGDDVDSNPSSRTVYVIQFKPVVELNVTDAKYATFIAPFDVELPSASAYVCEGVKGDVVSLSKVTGLIPAFTPVLLYSESSLGYDVTGNLQNNAEVYNGTLIVTVAGSDMPEQNADVAVVINRDGTMNFVLDNFVLEGFAGVGNIRVNGLLKDELGNFTFSGTTVITKGNDAGVEYWIGPELGVVPLEMNGRVTDNSLNVSISIDMTSTLQAAGDVKVKLSCEGVPVPSIVPSVGRMGLLTGVLEETSAPIGSYVLQNQDGNVAFYRVFEGEEYAKPVLPANRCYLTAPASSEAGVKAISFPEDPTAIDAVKDLLSGKAEIYDLEGRRLPALQKGLNIVNGKKVMVK